MGLSNYRVTIEFTDPVSGSPGPQPEQWPPYSNDIRLVHTQAGDRPEFTMYGGKQDAYTLAAEESAHLLDLLARMEVSAPWRSIFGFDGANCELTLRGAMSSMTFRWWSTVPPEWKRVGEVFDYVMHLARSHPASS